jgi:hypothetical protein
VTTTYWIGRSAVVEWPLTDIDGTPVVDATVTGTVTLPDGSTAPMDVTAGDPYRLVYEATTAGLHAYRAVATGSVDDAVEGTFVVLASLVGSLPITTDVSTAVGMVRLLINDVNQANPTFSDAEIGAFLTLEAGRPRRAAAQALDTIASNEVLVSKVIRTQDLQTDGSKVAAELRARAKALRDQDDQTDTDGNPFAMDIVDYDPSRAYCGRYSEPWSW